MFSKKRVKDTGSGADVAEGGETLGELSMHLQEKSANGHRIDFFDDASLMENLHLSNAFYDQNVPGECESQRHVVGPFLTFIKRIARRMVGWYVNPALDNQRLFNAYITRSINEMKRYLDHLQIDEDILSTIMRRDLALFRANIVFLNRFIERRMEDLEHEIAVAGRGGTGAATPAEPGDGGGDSAWLSSLDVLALEQRVHGSPRTVKERQKFYLQYFRKSSEVLAIGCGRGELLQLLQQEGISARGTDTNPVLAAYCLDNGLEVTREDPVQYIGSVEDSSLDGIVLSRFAGHQSPARLVRMLSLCREKLADGGVLVIETPNPFSLYAVASYALEDSDRIHPLHPETLKLLCLSSGFIAPALVLLNPLPPEEHLEELELTAGDAILDPREKGLFLTVNENFAKLNRILFSHRDYAVVTRKASPDEPG